MLFWYVNVQIVLVSSVLSIVSVFVSLSVLFVCEFVMSLCAVLCVHYSLCLGLEVQSECEICEEKQMLGMCGNQTSGFGSMEVGHACKV